MAGEVMTKAVDHIQNKLSEIINNKKAEIEPPNVEDLKATIIEDQQLWIEFRAELKENKIVTNVAIKEYLFVFMKKHRGAIEKQHVMSKKLEDESQRSEPNYLGTMKNTLRSKSNFSNLLTLVLQNCKSEINQ